MICRASLIIAAVLCGSVAHAATPAACWTMRKHGQRTQADACFTQLTRGNDAYARAEGDWGLEDWTAANEQFRSATQAADSTALYKVRWGMLLHERFNNPEAADLFREALVKDPNSAGAYLGLATISAEEYDGKATEYLAKAEALDPKLAAAHELAAKIALENDNRDLAATEADKAIALEERCTGSHGHPRGAGADCGSLSRCVVRKDCRDQPALRRRPTSRLRITLSCITASPTPPHTTARPSRPTRSCGLRTPRSALN